MPFSLTMAWRESRSSWPRFVFFFVCIAIGVGGIVGIGLFAENVERLILGDARSLLGGDIEIRSARPLAKNGLSVIESLRDRGIEVTHVSELVAMAATVVDEAGKSQLSPTQLVELKVVEDSYPLYGQVKTNPSGPLLNFFHPSSSQCFSSSCYGVLVQESLLYSLGVSIGSPLKIGQAHVVITGVLVKEPDRVAMGIGMGPRVMMSRQALQATELVKPGSRIRERYLLQVPSSYPLPSLTGELQGRLAKEGVRISTYREAQPRIKRFLDQLATYLGLIGLTALFVGGIGVGSTIHGFISQKMFTVAVLKTLGAETGFVLRTYLLQSLLMGGIGSLIGILLGIGFLRVLPVLLKDLVPFALTTHIFLFPVFKGLMLGVLAAGLFTLWPLLTVRQVPPALVFRRDITLRQTNKVSHSKWENLKNWVRSLYQDRVRLATGFIMGVGLSGLAIWQARSVWLGLVFVAAFGMALLVLHGALKVLMTILSKVESPRGFAVRQALGNVRRPGSQSSGMVVAIGIAVMVIVTIGLIKSALVTAIGDRMPTDAPTFFFVDIQPDQKKPFEDLIVRESQKAEYRLIPVVRSRLSALEGKPIDPQVHKKTRNGWYFTREYVLTALTDLPRDNEIVKGHWWPKEESKTHPEGTTAPFRAIGVSVEDEAAKNLGIDIGSTVEFDIQGTSLPTEVTSLRKVDWGGLDINFFMILSPGALEGAPFTYIGSAKVAPEEEVPLQQALVRALPNVTAIKIGDILQNIATLLEQLAWAIQGMAMLCMFSGAAVMMAAISTTRYRRLYESAILKAIGGTRAVILRSFAMEFVLIGALAGLLGVLLASMLSWVVLHFFLDLPWTFQITTLSFGLILTSGLAVVVGIVSTFRVLGEAPMAVLRQE